MAGPTSDGALRRVLLAGLAYGAFTLLVGLPLAGVMHRVFLLPPLFVPLVRGLLVAVGLVVLMAAWRYPHLGDGADDPRGGGRE